MATNLKSEMEKFILPHLPFVTMMLQKTKDTEYEKEWQRLNCFITSCKISNIVEIRNIDKTLREMKQNLRKKRSKNLSTVQGQKASTDEAVVVAGNESLKRKLSECETATSKFQKMSQDETNKSSSEPVVNSPELPMRAEVNEDDTIKLRMTSSPFLKIVSEEVPVELKRKKKNKIRTLEKETCHSRLSEQLETTAESSVDKIPILKLNLSKIFKESKKLRKLRKIQKETSAVEPNLIEEPEVLRQLKIPDVPSESLTCETTVELGNEPEDISVWVSDNNEVLDESCLLEEIKSVAPSTVNEINTEIETSNLVAELIKKFDIKDCYVQLARFIKTETSQLKIASENTNGHFENRTPEMEALIERQYSNEESPVSVEATLKVQQSPLLASSRYSVSHISCTITGQQVILKCLLCSFISESFPDFSIHLMESHFRQRWFGACNSCPADNMPLIEVGTLQQELEHLRVAHVQSNDIPPPLTSNQSETSQKSYTSENAEIPKFVESDGISRISTTPPMVIIPSLLLGKMESNQRSTNPRKWLQWSTVKDQKPSSLSAEMLSKDCLVALFKCMGKTCAFYTSLELLFRRHIMLHARYQSDEKHNFMQCSYCPFQAEHADSLTNHIIIEHGCDKYQCPYCFYRCNGFQFDHHMRTYHPRNKKLIYECYVTGNKKEFQEIANIWKYSALNVRPMSCMICKMKFYNIERFIKHLELDHKCIPTTKCIKCEEPTNIETTRQHLTKCHGFGRFQCAFCRFGMQQMTDVISHLTQRHSSNYPYYFDRSTIPSVKESTEVIPSMLPKMVTLKCAILKLSDEYEIQSSPSAESLNNIKNVNRLSDYFCIDSSVAEALELTP